MTSPSLFYREVSLTQGQVTLVDLERYNWAMQWHWHARWSHTTRSWYAARDTSINCKTVRYWMHLELLGVKRGGDHIDGNTLDNRLHNLRPATHGQNMQNRKRPSHNTSGYKGVIWQNGKWRARIMVGKKSISLGMFNEIVPAAKAYNVAALQYHGEFANLNEIA